MEQNKKDAADGRPSQKKYPREDRALKAASQMLGEALLSLTELGLTFKRMIPTEQVVLHTEDFLEDFNFETNTGEIVHLEFETDDITEEDLRRFRCYEAILSYQQKKDVYTCVLCSAPAENLLDEIPVGMNIHRVKVIRLKDWKADEVLEQIEGKQSAIHPLTKEELLKLILLPLMGGSLNQKERISRGFQILRGEREYQKKADLLQMEGVLYILAEKFLNKIDLDELKEEIKVTRLGQMLYDDGWDAGLLQGIMQGREEGIEQGIEQGIGQGLTRGITRGLTDMILDFLTDLGDIPQNLTNLIRSTTDETTLRTWGKIAGRAGSLEEFYEKTGIKL